jgi:hypothetical protein
MHKDMDCVMSGNTPKNIFQLAEGFEWFALAQFLEFVVDLLDVIGFIVFEISVIELEVVGFNVCKSHCLILFDYHLQIAHALRL